MLTSKVVMESRQVFRQSIRSRFFHSTINCQQEIKSINKFSNNLKNCHSEAFSGQRRRSIQRLQQFSTSTSSTEINNNNNSNNNNNNNLLLYMWGTDSNGSILKQPNKVQEQLNNEQEQKQSNKEQEQKLFDIPHLIDNWKDLMKITDSTTTIQSIVCGPTDTGIILSDGRCFVSGTNKNGLLGLGHTQPVQSLKEVILPVEDPINTKIKQVALGTDFAAYVDTAGDLYTCGYGGSSLGVMGQLGHGNNESYTTPKLVESLVEDGCYVQKVTVGEAHMTVLTTEGEVLTTGGSSYGRLGNFGTVDQLYLAPVELLTIDSGIIDISGGKSYTLALTNDGVIYAWGRNHKGQLGIGLGLSVDMYAMSEVPEPIQSDLLISRKVIKIASGHSHAACITESGELFYWGMTLFFEPIRVDELLHTKIIDVVCGQDYILAIDENKHMYSLGIGKTGVLGQGSIKRSNQATHMEAFGPEIKIQQVAAGWKHASCLAVKE